MDAPLSSDTTELERTPLNDYRLFEPLLTLLRLRGFAIGTDDYLRLQTLLLRIDPRALLRHIPPEVWKETLARTYADLLRPLFTTVPEQQAKFDAIFTDAWPLIWPPDGTPLSPFAVPPPDETEPALEPEGRPEARIAALEALRRQREAERSAAQRGAEEAKQERERAVERRSKLRRRRWRLLALAACLSLLLLCGAMHVPGKGLLYRSPYLLEPYPPGKSLSFLSSQTGENGRFPEQRITRVLRRRDNAPFALNGRDVPQLVLYYTSPQEAKNSPFRIVLPAEAASKAAGSFPITLVYAPRDKGASFARLAFQSSAPSGSFPILPALNGVARPYYNFRFRFGEEAGPASIPIPNVAGGDTSGPIQLALEEETEHPFVPSAEPRLSGKGSEYFTLTTLPGFKNNRPTHPFQIVFHPAKNYQAEDMEAVVSYNSGRADAENPLVTPLKTAENTVDKSRIVTADATLTITAKPEPPLPSPLPFWKAAFLGALFWLAGFAALYFLFKWRDGRDTGEKPKGPPFDWELQTGAPDRPFTGSLFAETAALLSPPVRVDEANGVFDVAATVRATANRAGFSMPIFRPRRAHPPEYLLLFQKVSRHDARAAYFAAFARALARQGLALKVFTYDRDPARCAALEGTDSYSLERLHALYPNHRLLVFGEDAALVHLPEGELTQTARLLDQWKIWALFTLENLGAPGLRAAALRRAFPPERFRLLPATLEGLRRFALAFPVNPASRQAGDREKKPEQQPDPIQPLDPEVIGVRAYADALADSYDDRRLFLWLCACALYPRLSYELTLLIGMQIERLRRDRLCTKPEDQIAAPLVTTENLRLLLRLPFFETGEMSAEMRMELQKRLKKERDIERAVRGLLMTLLESPPLPPPDSIARDRFELERRVQAWMLSQSKHAPPLRREMQRVSAYVVDTHPLLKPLLRQQENDLWADRPRWLEKWRNFRYPGSLPHGDRFPRLNFYVAQFLLACGLLAWLALSPIGPRIPNPNHELIAAIQPKTLAFGAVGPDQTVMASIKIVNQTNDSLDLDAQLLTGSTEQASSVKNAFANDASPTDTLLVPTAPVSLYSQSKPQERTLRIQVFADRDTRHIAGPLTLNLTIPVVLNSIPVRFEPQQPMHLSAEAGKSALKTVTLVGKNLPPPVQLLSRLSISEPFSVALAGRTKRAQTSGGEQDVQTLNIIFQSPVNDAPGTSHKGLLSYTDTSRAKTTLALTGITTTPAVIQKLIADLKSNDPKVRSHAAEELGRIGPAAAQAIPALIATFKDSTDYVRMSAEAALGKIGLAAFPALMTALHNPDPQVGKSAVSAFRKMGRAVVPLLIASLKHGDSDTRSSATFVLNNIGRDAAPAVPALKVALNDPDLYVSNGAARALGNIEPFAALIESGSATVDSSRLVSFGPVDTWNRITVKMIATPLGSRFLKAFVYTNIFYIESAPTRAFAPSATHELLSYSDAAVRRIAASGRSSITLITTDLLQKQPYPPGSVFYIRVRFINLSDHPEINRSPLIMSIHVPKPAPTVPVTVEPKALDFGTVRPGDTPVKTITLTGPSNLKITDLQILDAYKDVRIDQADNGASEFSAQLSGSLASQQSPQAKIEVTFHAKTDGIRKARLRILHNGSISPLDVPLSATVSGQSAN